MLKITISDLEIYNESKNEFETIKGQTIALEHSLVSVSKWESKWKVPFFGKEQKTNEQTIDYIRCMTLTQNVNPLLYTNINAEHVKLINDYISDPMTATWFRKEEKASSREIITSEIIYYWMIETGIPMECQKWHINRLLTLIKVCNEKRKPQKKMSKNEIMARNKALNAQRRAKMNSKG